jgi:glycosyltransferase involved in cell wall biosynthesis
MSWPLVSVIIPNYNYGRYLEQAIGSALAQDYPSVEVVVVDDGSTDASSEVAARFGGRIRWIQQQRQGVAAARNRGVEESRGELVAFLDADDYWSPRKLSRQVAAMGRGAVMAYCGLEFVSIAGDRLGVSVSGPRGRILRDIVLLRSAASPGLGSTALIRRDALERAGGFDPAVSTSTDWDLWRRLSCRGEVEYVPEVLASYRLHGGAMHRDVSVFERDMRLAFAKTFADPAAAEVHPLRRRCYGNLYVMLSGSYWQAGDWRRALSFAAMSVRVWPPSLGYLAAFPARRLGRLRVRIGDPQAQIVLPAATQPLEPVA